MRSILKTSFAQHSGQFIHFANLVLRRGFLELRFAFGRKGRLKRRITSICSLRNFVLYRRHAAAALPNCCLPSPPSAKIGRPISSDGTPQDSDTRPPSTYTF